MTVGYSSIGSRIDDDAFSALIAPLEPQAQKIIIQRYPGLRDWLYQQFAAHPDWRDDLLHPDTHQQFQPLLTDLERRVTHWGSTSFVDLKEGAQSWRIDYLLPLAARFALATPARQAVLHQCRNRGYFDRPQTGMARRDQHHPHALHPVQPASRPLLRQVCALLQRTPDPQERIQALVQTGFCRNQGTAQAVIAIVAQSERDADRTLVRTALRDGVLASAADHPGKAQVDAIVDRIRAVIQRVPDTEPQAMALVHAGLCPTVMAAHAVVARVAQRATQPDRYVSPVRRCLKRGLFTHAPVRPTVDGIAQRIHAIFAVVRDADHRVPALLQAGICRQETHARQFVAQYPDRSAAAAKNLIHHGWNAGWFDMTPSRCTAPQPPAAIRPPFPEIVRWTAFLLHDGAEMDQQVRAMVALELCRDDATARQVVAALDYRNPDSLVSRHAAALARGILWSYAAHGLVGLLQASDYNPADLLMYVQRAVPSIDQTSANPATTLAALRRDLPALYRAFEHVDGTLWKRDVLNAPIVSNNRTSCQQRIALEQRFQIIAALQAQHGYGEDEATVLYDLLVDRGIFGLIDWRCGISLERAGHAWEDQRLRHILDYHLGALEPRTRNLIEQFAQSLKAAMQQTGATISLTQLLNSQPSSSFRRRLNRRMPVAYGVVQFFRRKDAQTQQQRHHLYRARVRDHPQAARDNPLACGSMLVARCAAMNGLHEKDAANRLYQVRTYGGIGFLPKEHWFELVDARLLGLLKFYTFARIDGRHDIHQSLRQVNHYAALLGLAPWSTQLAKALNGAMRKPGRWNSGESERMAAVRKRGGVVLPGAPWLHRVWRMFHIELRLPISASRWSSASAVSHVLLVVDLGSQLPLGLWVSAHLPGSTEVGLALFQAIWHPGALDWPLRGAPEVLQVPEALLADGGDDLTRAAEWLLMRVQIVKSATQVNMLSKLSITRSVIKDLMSAGLGTIRRKHAGQNITVREVQDALLGWIRTSDQGFAVHTPGQDDPVSVMYGLTTPAFNTPAAGLLLPITGETQTVNGGVIIDDSRFYTSADCSLASGLVFRYRAFPYRYKSMRDAIYVEDQHGVLHYLLRHPYTAEGK